MLTATAFCFVMLTGAMDAPVAIDAVKVVTIQYSTLEERTMIRFPDSAIYVTETPREVVDEIRLVCRNQ